MVFEPRACLERQTVLLFFNQEPFYATRALGFNHSSESMWQVEEDDLSRPVCPNACYSC